VFSAHRPLPQLQVQDSVMGRRPIVGIAYIQTGKGFLFRATFTTWPDLCADLDWRSGVNQGRGSLFLHTGCTTQ
jgi:hypothetical protein